MQPRNVLCGHVFSAAVGVACRQLFLELPPWPGGTWFVAALAVSLAILLMQACDVLHPPGGATALIAVIGDASVHKVGWMFLLTPVFSGAAMMTLVALLVNNVPGSGRTYPQWW